MKNLKQFGNIVAGNLPIVPLTIHRPIQIYLNGMFYNSMSIFLLYEEVHGCFYDHTENPHMKMKLYTG